MFTILTLFTSYEIKHPSCGDECNLNKGGLCCILVPTFNLLDIIKNIWLQQYGKRSGYLYVATLDDYVQAFKQYALCYGFVHGSCYNTKLDRDELWLCRMSQSSDHDFTNGYCSHQICFRFFIYIEDTSFGRWKGLWIHQMKARSIPMIRRQFAQAWLYKFFLSMNGIHLTQLYIQYKCGLFELFTRGFPNFHSQWWGCVGTPLWWWCLAHWTMSLQFKCSMFDIAKGHKTLLQSEDHFKKWNHGIPIPCYVGNWSVCWGATIELHKFWFYHDDHNHFVGGTGRK